MLLLIGLASASCTQMPHKEGPRARLLPGIETPRNREDVDITLYERSFTAWGKCLSIVNKADDGSWQAILSVITLSPIHACARVARDRDLKPGQKPWCIVAVPKGDEIRLEHEIRHCEGWDHPSPKRSKNDVSR